MFVHFERMGVLAGALFLFTIFLFGQRFNSHRLPGDLSES